MQAAGRPICILIIIGIPVGNFEETDMDIDRDSSATPDTSPDTFEEEEIESNDEQ